MWNILQKYQCDASVNIPLLKTTVMTQLWSQTNGLTKSRYRQSRSSSAFTFTRLIIVEVAPPCISGNNWPLVYNTFRSTLFRWWKLSSFAATSTIFYLYSSSEHHGISLWREITLSALLEMRREKRKILNDKLTCSKLSAVTKNINSQTSCPPHSIYSIYPKSC